MSSLDFNSAGEQREFGELIPENALCKVVMKSASDLKISRLSDAQYLECEFTVLAGKYARRKIFQNFVLEGGKKDDQGRSKAGAISRATLRAVIESARNIQPADMSDAALNGRSLSGYADFNGMELAVKVGVDLKEEGSQYSDSNSIKLVITPDKPEYADIMSGKDMPEPEPVQRNRPKARGNSAAAASNPAPGWAAGGQTAQPQQHAQQHAQQQPYQAQPPQDQQQGDLPAWAK